MKKIENLNILRRALDIIKTITKHKANMITDKDICDMLQRSDGNMEKFILIFNTEWEKYEKRGFTGEYGYLAWIQFEKVLKKICTKEQWDNKLHDFYYNKYYSLQQDYKGECARVLSVMEDKFDDQVREIKETFKVDEQTIQKKRDDTIARMNAIANKVIEKNFESLAIIEYYRKCERELWAFFSKS